MTTGIILTGGKSTRLGRDKAFIKLRGQNILEYIITILNPIVNELIIVTTEEKQIDYSSFESKLKVVIDIYPDKAALGGLYTGLSYSNNNYSIVVACDMPFLNKDLLEYMVEISDGYDAVVPQIDNYVEPLHGIYSRNCLNIAKKLIKQNDLSIYKLAKMINTRFVSKKEIQVYDPEITSLFNINSELDLQKAEQIIEKRNYVTGS